MTFRHFLTLAMAGFLTLSSLPARPSALGVVEGAARVHLNTTGVTTGATVYDGDRFSTEAGGWLRVRSGAAVLELAGESVVSVRNQASGAQGLEAELGKGTLVLSAARAASMNVIALEANIRPVADSQTVTQVSVTGPKELLICARRGALRLTYHQETKIISEGKTYRVILGPPNNSPRGKEPVHARKWPKGFKIVIIGEGAAVLGLGIYELLEPESPDRP